MKMIRFAGVLTACAVLMGSFTACASDLKYSGNDLPEYAYDEDTPSLYEEYADYFNIGAAINTSDLEEGTNQYNLITKQFNVFTMENDTKPDHIHPSEDTYNFTSTDKFVEYGEANDKILRGHTLVWHSQCPDWFFYDDEGNEVSADVLVERMKEHITTIVSRYKGKIDTWDVVNEVLDDSYGLRFSNWLKIVGDYDGDGDKYDFIEIAFRTAHEADPDARLIINDYSLETNTNKAITMYNMVKTMLEEGVPVDGVGLQMHIGYDTDIELARDNIEILAGLKEINPDFVIEITELDMSCYSWGDESTEVELTDEFVQQFDDKYCELFNMLMDFAEEGLVDTVVFLGYNDGATWLNGYPVANRTNHPLLIDRDLKFKSAYWALMNLPSQRQLSE